MQLIYNIVFCAIILFQTADLALGQGDVDQPAPGNNS